MILPVSYILPWMYIREMDLLSFASMEPVFDPLIDLFANSIRNRCSNRNIVNLDTFFFGVADLTYDVWIFS